MTRAVVAGLDPRASKLAWVLGAAGLIGCGLGLMVDATQAFRSWLFAFIFWLEPALGCLAFLMLHNLVGGSWGRQVRPYLASGALTLPWLAVVFLPLAFGLARVYPWAASGAMQDPLIRHQLPYLNQPFFLVRAAIYFLIWAGLAWRLARAPAAEEKGKAWSAPGLILLAFAGQFAATDWTMSLEPHWHSTMYGFLFLSQAAPATLALLLLTSAAAPRPESDPAAFRDLGSLLLAFLVIWIYASFFQYMLIWFGDRPEEIAWYLKRNAGGWRWLARGFTLFYFVAPFFLLLFRANRGSPRRLAWLGGGLLLIHLAYIFWFIVPSYRGGIGVHWLDAAAWVAVGGIWIGAYLRSMEKAVAHG